MQYTIESIDNGKATVRYPDGSWAEFLLEDSMTESEIDDLAYQFRPKTGSAPSFISEGQSRTAAELDRTSLVQDDRPEWLVNRVDAYGTIESQIEYIVENGLEAWQAEVAAIKAQYPKE